MVTRISFPNRELSTAAPSGFASNAECFRRVLPDFFQPRVTELGCPTMRGVRGFADLQTLDTVS